MPILVMKNGQWVQQTSGSQYNGDKTGGEFANWKTHSVSPSHFLRQTYTKLASRCATLYNTSSFVRACVRKPLMYSIGKGIVFRSHPNAEFLGMDREDAIAWGKKFTELLHYDKLAIDYYSKQYELKIEQDIVGDSVLLFLDSDDDSVPFDIVCQSGALAIDATKEAKDYTLGIRHDNYGRRMGFWSTTEKRYIPFRIDGEQNAIQFMIRERAAQLRGYSSFYSTVALSKNLDRVWDATIERMVMESIQMGYFSASDTDVGAQARGMARAAMGRTQNENRDNTVSEIAGTSHKPGGMYHLKNSESMQFTDLKTPSNNFSNANNEANRQFAMARNVAPEFVIGEYSTSFTAHKGALNDTMKQIFLEREMFIRKVESVVNLKYLKHYVRTGQIEVKPSFWENRSVQMAYLQGKYLGEVPGHVNPLQEVKAQAEAVKNGFALQSDFSPIFGHPDHDSFLDAWEEEQNRFFAADPEEKAKRLMEASQE